MQKIMFSDKFLLTQAVLEGRKTQTRRIVPQKELDKISLFQKEYYNATFDKLEGVELLTHYFLTEKCGKLPYNVGEVVAVAQSYIDCGNLPDYELDEDGYPIMPKRSGFFNKMFVRADLMPYQIRITDVRVERLQDISDGDCLKEGIEEFPTKSTLSGKAYTFNGINESYKTPQEAFAYLINKVNRKDVWKENPYVFVYDFELLNEKEKNS